MPRYALRIEYDGRPYVGWQWQAAHPSVQATLEAAVARIAPEAPPVTGAGRTDGGVHALGQVAHVDLARAWDPFRLQSAINAHLRPAPVAVVAAAEVGEGFHARFSAVEREYLYRVIARRPPLVHDRGLAWRVGHRLDLDAMRAGAAALVGRHDFTTFRSSICQAKSPVRTMDAVEIDAGDARAAAASIASASGRGRSCTTRSAASSARSSGSAPAPGRRRGWRRPSPPAAAPPAARSARRTGSTSSRSATRRTLSSGAPEPRPEAATPPLPLAAKADMGEGGRAPARTPIGGPMGAPMNARDPQLLVSTAWLADHLGAPDLRILDASWYLPADNRDPRAEYEAAHIPGARFFDIDEISDDQSDLPHMAPPVEKFVARMRAMGIGDGHRVVVYDGAGLFSAAARLVAVPALRQDRRRRARRRLPEVEGRGPPGRGRRRPSSATATSPRAATPASSATSPRSRRP